MNRTIGLGLTILVAPTVPAVAQMFETPTVLEEAGPLASWPSIAEDGLALYFNHDVVNGGDQRLFVMRRASLTDAWELPELVYDSRPTALGPRVSRDGLELFAYAFADGVRQIYSSRRSSLDATFPRLGRVTELASPSHRGPGCLSLDGLTLYYWTGGIADTRYATRDAIGEPFMDQGEVSTLGPVGWISDDQRVGFTWGMSVLRRDSPTDKFTLERHAGPVTAPLTGAPSFLPATGELFYWRDDGSGEHELMLSERKDTLVSYSDLQVGGEIELDIYGRPVELWVLAASLATADSPFPPFGSILLGDPLVLMGIGLIPSQGFLWSAVEDPFPATFELSIPNDPDIAGLTVYWQAWSADRVFQTVGGLTNRVATTLY